MGDGQFLSDLYKGILDNKRFSSFRDIEGDETTREIIENFLAFQKEYPPSLLEEKGAIPENLLKKLSELGFFGLNIPSRYGGMGLDLLQYLKVVEEVAASDMALAILSLAHLSIGTKGIVLYGNERQKNRYLVPAARGEMIFSYALTEPLTGSDAKNIQTKAILSEDGKYYLLNGQKTYITNANYAGGLTVFAQLNPEKPGFMGAFVVETAREGVSIGRDMPKMGLKASSTASINFNNVKVPVENLLARPGDGFKIAMSILNYGRMALGAASSGIMKQSYEDMKMRAKKRIQFSVPINSFELIQEKMVKAKVYGAVTEAMTAFTAGMLMDDPVSTVAMESSHCKLFGTTKAWDALYDGLQVAGGAGYLSNMPYEKRMRDFRVATVFEGTTEIHSIYPPVYLIRRLNRSIKAFSGGGLKTLLFLISGMLGEKGWKTPLSAVPVMKKGARFIRSSSRKIRLLIYGGLLVYGRNIVQKEFFLRRITFLSCYLYGTICMMARINNRKRRGADVCDDRKVLAYFIEDGLAWKKSNVPFITPGVEKMQKNLLSDITEENNTAG